MTDWKQGWPAETAANRNQVGTTSDPKQIQGDVNRIRGDRFDVQCLQQGVESCVPSCCHEEADGDSQEELVLHGEQERRLAQEEQAPNFHENAWNLLNAECFVELTLVYIPAKARSFIAFVLRPSIILLCLMVTRKWMCSLWLLTKLKVPMLTLLTYVADFEMTVNIEGIPENMRGTADAVVFVLVVLVRLLFSVSQFFKCQRVARMVWSHFVTPASFYPFEDRKCLTYLPRTLPELYASKTSAGLPWASTPSDYLSDDILASSGHVYGSLIGEELGVLTQMQHKYRPHMAPSFLENAFAAFVWMCALYVVVLVTVTVFVMVLGAITDVLTLYTSYTIYRSTGGASRSKALQEAVQKCTRDKDCKLLDRIKWCLQQLTSKNREDELT